MSDIVRPMQAMDIDRVYELEKNLLPHAVVA